MRDWLVIVGVLVVLIVLADGLRRMWLARRKANELNFGLEDVQGQSTDFGSELPNGGARVRDGEELSDDAPEDSDTDSIDLPPVRRREPVLQKEKIVSKPRARKEPSFDKPSFDATSGAGSGAPVESSVKAAAKPVSKPAPSNQAPSKIESSNVEPEGKVSTVEASTSGQSRNITDIAGDEGIGAVRSVSAPQSQQEPRPERRPAAAPQKSQTSPDQSKSQTVVEDKTVSEKKPASTDKPVFKDKSVLPGQQALALDEPVPMLMDMDDEGLSLSAPPRSAKPPTQKQAQAPAQKRESLAASLKADLENSIMAGRRKLRSYHSSETAEESEIEEMTAQKSAVEESEAALQEDNQTQEVKRKDEVLVINVVAPEDRPFSGDQLLQFFRQYGLRFGDMNIFHRHEQEDGTGKILFSVANGVEPGTFNLRTMDNSVTPALSFFLGLPGPENPKQAFRTMVEAVHYLEQNMGACLKDEHHSVLTTQTLTHYQERIIEFERRYMVSRKRSNARV